MSEVPSLSPQRVKECMERGDCVMLLDVRTPAEHRSVHASGAKNIPLDTLSSDACKALCAEAGDGKVYVICKSGARARMAAQKLAGMGLRNAIVVEGGTDAWEQAGLPVERGKAAMSLERQVRIAAGTLVAGGVLLSLLVHPAFVYLSLFVGCGLVFAGVTDTCMMGMLISKMPWNRV